MILGSTSTWGSKLFYFWQNNRDLVPLPQLIVSDFGTSLSTLLRTMLSLSLKDKKYNKLINEYILTRDLKTNICYHYI